MTDTKKILQEAISNIREDRKKALSLLEDLAEFIGQSQDRHKDVGQTAAKYLETLQRSNEQLVKITALMQKDRNDEFGDLGKEEAESLYDEFDGDE